MPRSTWSTVAHRSARFAIAVWPPRHRRTLRLMRPARGAALTMPCRWPGGYPAPTLARPRARRRQSPRRRRVLACKLRPRRSHQSRAPRRPWPRRWPNHRRPSRRPVRSSRRFPPPWPCVSARRWPTHIPRAEAQRQSPRCRFPAIRCAPKWSTPASSSSTTTSLPAGRRALPAWKCGAPATAGKAGECSRPTTAATTRSWSASTKRACTDFASWCRAVAVPSRPNAATRPISGSASI